MTIRIMLVDDHQIVLDGIRLVIQSQPDMKVVGQAKDGRQGVEMAAEVRPDIILMDIGIPKLNGVEATKRIIRENPNIKIIALSVHTDAKFVLEMLRAGAKGYLPKDTDSSELLEGIHAVMNNKSYLSPLVADGVLSDYLESKKDLKGATSSALTPKETEVLQLIAEGKSSKEIATELDISVRTVEAHRGNIMKKLKVSGVAELTKYAIRHGLIVID